MLLLINVLQPDGVSMSESQARMKVSACRLQEDISEIMKALMTRWKGPEELVIPNDCLSLVSAD